MIDPVRLLALLDELGIVHHTHSHPPVLTVKQADAYWRGIDAIHAKNLLLKDAAGAHWLVVAPAAMSIDLRRLPGRIGSKRLSFASAETLADLLGVTTGAVSPFALVNDHARVVRPILDETLRNARAIGFHPLDNRRTTIIAGSGLVAFLNHLDARPSWLDLTA